MRITLIAFILLSLHSIGSASPVQTINAPAFTKPPVINGTISKDEWDEASGAPVALNISNGQATSATAEFRIGYFAAPKN